MDRQTGIQRKTDSHGHTGTKTSTHADTQTAFERNTFTTYSTWCLWHRRCYWRRDLVLCLVSRDLRSADTAGCRRREMRSLTMLHWLPVLRERSRRKMRTIGVALRKASNACCPRNNAYVASSETTCRRGSVSTAVDHQKCLQWPTQIHYKSTMN